MMYEVLLIDDELQETLVAVEASPGGFRHNQEWFNDELIPAVIRAGYDPDLIEDFWEAGEDEEG